MIHGTVFCQSSYWRQNTKCICCQKHNHFWISSQAWNDSSWNVIKWVCDSGIFSDAAIVEIWFHGVFVYHHVFQNSTKPYCVPYLRFCITIQIDTLCITSSFKIKDALV